MVPVVPTASRYAAVVTSVAGQLAVRGSCYTLALFVPVCVVLMVLAEPILEVWLGDRYGGGATALAILVSALVCMVGSWSRRGLPRGRRPGRARWGSSWLALLSSTSCSPALTPELGIEGPALGTAIPFFLAFPLMPRAWVSASGAGLWSSRWGAWLPPTVW